MVLEAGSPAVSQDKIEELVGRVPLWSAGSRGESTPLLTVLGGRRCSLCLKMAVPILVGFLLCESLPASRGTPSLGPGPSSISKPATEGWWGVLRSSAPFFLLSCSLALLLSSSVSKGPCDYIVPTCVIQDSLPILKPSTLILSPKSPLRWRHNVY